MTYTQPIQHMDTVHLVSYLVYALGIRFGLNNLRKVLNQGINFPHRFQTTSI